MPDALSSYEAQCGELLRVSAWKFFAASEFRLSAISAAFVPDKAN